MNNETQLQDNSRSAIKPVLGISECLTGAEVRFNGGHKRNRYCTDVLSEYVEFKTACPEVGIGLSTPRPAIRMVAHGDDVEQVKVIATDQPQIDHAPQLKNYAQTIQPQFRDISGFIFMQKSPSCGLHSGKIYRENGYPASRGSGVFAEEMVRLNPQLPVIEAGQLNDAGLRENFLTQVYAYQDWQLSVAANLTVNSILEFHRRHKLQIRIHHEPSMRILGRLLANLKGVDLEPIANEYFQVFMAALKKNIGRPQQANLLYRIQKHMKRKLNKSEKAKVMDSIDQYRKGIVPMIVPMTLLQFFLEKYELKSNVSVMAPYPEQLGLRSSI